MELAMLIARRAGAGVRSTKNLKAAT